MRHKHADVIHAWAEGAEIQSRHGPEYFWSDISLKFPCTFFNEDLEYRVKPKILRTKRYLYSNPESPQVGICREGYLPVCSVIRWIDEDWVEIEA